MCYTFNDRMSAMRIFKTKWFAREASSHGISDDELYQAIQSALQGKVVDLGEGVYKKRLNKNRDRAIILTKSAEYWFYTFLYAKQDMANIKKLLSPDNRTGVLKYTAGKIYETVNQNNR